jgi:hypothetical protein
MRKLGICMNSANMVLVTCGLWEHTVLADFKLHKTVLWYISKPCHSYRRCNSRKFVWQQSLDLPLEAGFLFILGNRVLLH